MFGAVEERVGWIFSMSGNKDYSMSEVKTLKLAIKNLKAQATRLARENRRLKADLVSLEKSFAKSIRAMKDEWGGVPIEDIVAFYAKSNKAKEKLAGEITEKDAIDREAAAKVKAKAKKSEFTYSVEVFDYDSKVSG